VFFLRLGQRIVHLLTMHSAAGRLYEVDMRLRPNGKGGFLMTGIDAFERYQREDAWTWEHQALLRARAVAAMRICARRSRRRGAAFCVPRCIATPCAPMCGDAAAHAARTVQGRRGPVRHQAGRGRHRRHRVPGAILGAGGRQRHPELLTYTDNIRQLEGLAAVGVLEPATAQWLTEAYIGYRTVLHHLSLEGRASGWWRRRRMRRRARGWSRDLARTFE
jgi:glutamate-ammonia-ligase adenylyltransferase